MALPGERKTGPFSVRAQKAILSRHRTAFLKYLHVSEIRPYLYQHGLLSEDQFDELSSDQCNRTEKINKVLKWIPKKGPDALKKLVLSIQESSSGTGTAHDELASELKQSLQSSDSGNATSRTKLVWFSLLIISILVIVIFNLQSSTHSFHKPASTNLWTEPIPNIHPSKSLPFPLEHFIGREKEMDDLNQLLAFDTSDIRGVSVVGPPGVGKSTLAIHTGQMMKKRGMVIHYVDLYQVSDIYSTKSNILRGVEFHAEFALNDPVLVWARSVDTQTVLILDNCDDILHSNKDKFQALVKDILRSSSLIKTLLTTKQMASFLGKFQIYQLSELSTESAITLLRNIDHNIEPSQANSISELVGRMPLALQVLGSLLQQPDPPSSKVIITELQREPIAFLSPEGLQETEKVQTSIHISYSYLSLECQEGIRLLANFPGSFTMEAATSILKRWRTTHCIKILHARSLLVYYQHSDRFQFHRLIKEYILNVQKSLPVMIYEVEQELFWVEFLRHYLELMHNVSTNFTDVYTMTEKWKIVDIERQNFDVLFHSSRGDTPIYSLLRGRIMESKHRRKIYSMLETGLVALGAKMSSLLKRAIYFRKQSMCRVTEAKHLLNFEPEYHPEVVELLKEQRAKDPLKYIELKLWSTFDWQQKILRIDLCQYPIVNDIGYEEFVKVYTDLLLMTQKLSMIKTRSGAPEVLELRRDRLLDLYSRDTISTLTKIKLYTKFYSALATAYILDNKHLQFMDCWRAILQVKKKSEPCRQQDCSHSYLGLAYYGEGDYERCVHHLEIAWQASEGSTKKRARYLVVLYHAYKEIGTEEKALQVVNVLYEIVVDKLLNFADVNAQNYRTCIILASFFRYLNTQQSVEFAEYLWNRSMLHIRTYKVLCKTALAAAIQGKPSWEFTCIKKFHLELLHAGGLFLIC